MTTDHGHSAVVVDDHPLVARGIADYLRTHCGFARAEAICHADGLWTHLAQVEVPSLALVDFWLPEGTALPMLSASRRVSGHAPAGDQW